MAGKVWAGLDVGAETTSICVIDDAGQIVHEAVCPTNVRSVHRELKFLKRRRFARVGLESGMGISLARGLRNLGYSIDIYESRKLSKFLRVRRNKTDAGDASGIAEAGRLATSVVSKVYMKDLDSQMLGSRLTVRRHLIRSRVRALNLLGRQLEFFGGRLTRCISRNLKGKVEAQIKELFGKTSNPFVTDLRYLLGRCEELYEFQKRMDRDLIQLARQSDVCQRLMEIPGVGPICALTFYSSVGEPCRFRYSADIGSYLGLTPRLHQSGVTHRLGRISKMGNAAARTMLVTASMQFMRWGRTDTELHAWASRIAQRRGPGRARVALARKLAIIMLSIWKKGERYQPRLVKP